ncbi:MAG: DNA/RNA nuclease SfsA [Bdellovibrionaceae bacterium]|jgi:sugar fermentation stimulation protein A|nr:DNA/RNA nuclease SfsA [Pseudobdellovibrionaceae bacterium]
MDFKDNIFEGQFVKRYKRFFTDIRTPEGEVLTAHCPNTGSMKGCLIEDAPCKYTYVDDPKRKLKYTLQAIKAPTSWIGVNTHLTNQLVWEAWETKAVEHWHKYNHAQREVKISDKSRIDLVLWDKEQGLEKIKKLDEKTFNDHKFHFVEVKNVTLTSDTDPSMATFPDSVTTRGQKHLEELVHLVEKGHTAEIFFLIQREDCNRFTPADDIDPKYGELLRTANDAGVQVTAYACNFQGNAITINPENIKIIL